MIRRILGMAVLAFVAFFIVTNPTAPRPPPAAWPPSWATPPTASAASWPGSPREAPSERPPPWPGRHHQEEAVTDDPTTTFDQASRVNVFELARRWADLPAVLASSGSPDTALETLAAQAALVEHLARWLPSAVQLAVAAGATPAQVAAAAGRTPGEVAAMWSDWHARQVAAGLVAADDAVHARVAAVLAAEQADGGTLSSTTGTAPLADLSDLLDSIEADNRIEEEGLTFGELNYREGVLHTIAFLRDAVTDGEVAQ